METKTKLVLAILDDSEKIIRERMKVCDHDNRQFYLGKLNAYDWVRDLLEDTPENLKFLYNK